MKVNFIKLLMLFLIMLSGNAHALTYAFFQGGFDDGAYITGTFSGADLNADSQLSTFTGSEITNFSATFSGNSVVSSFTLEFRDLWGVVYDLDGGSLGDGLSSDIEGIRAESSLFSYVVGPGLSGVECGIGVDCGYVSEGAFYSFSQDLVQVSTVPIPASIFMLASGLIGLFSFKLRA